MRLGMCLSAPGKTDVSNAAPQREKSRPEEELPAQTARAATTTLIPMHLS
jgi:hypothetical protein